MSFVLNLISEAVIDTEATDAAWVHAKIVDNAESPEEANLDELRLWLDQRSTGQAEMYNIKKWHEFRMLTSPKGPIEKLVKALMPLSRLGRIFLVSVSPFIPTFSSSWMS